VKVCKAISVAETGGCSDGTAKKRMNCHGIMTWKKGHREPKYYKSQEESHLDCQRIWKTYYGKLPNMKLAIKWTGADNASNWLRNFYLSYNSL
jgi:hypothetical protein